MLAIRSMGERASFSTEMEAIRYRDLLKGPELIGEHNILLCFPLYPDITEIERRSKGEFAKEIAKILEEHIGIESKTFALVFPSKWWGMKPSKKEIRLIIGEGGKGERRWNEYWEGLGVSPANQYTCILTERLMDIGPSNMRLEYFSGHGKGYEAIKVCQGLRKHMRKYLDETSEGCNGCAFIKLDEDKLCEVERLAWWGRDFLLAFQKQVGEGVIILLIGLSNENFDAKTVETIEEITKSYKRKVQKLFKLCFCENGAIKVNDKEIATVKYYIRFPLLVLLADASLLKRGDGFVSLKKLSDDIEGICRGVKKLDSLVEHSKLKKWCKSVLRELSVSEDRIVTEDNVRKSVQFLRNVISSSVGKSSFIENKPGKGYRLSKDVRCVFRVC